MRARGRRRDRLAAGPIPYQEAPEGDERRLSFSFKYFEFEHQKFNVKDCSKGFFVCLARALAKYSTFTVDEFRHPDKLDPHRHQLHFEGLSEPEGFVNVDPTATDLWTEEAFQFPVTDDHKTPEGKGRVHGFLAEGVFYIVWFDPNHKLDPNNHPNFGGRRKKT